MLTNATLQKTVKRFSSIGPQLRFETRPNPKTDCYYFSVWQHVVCMGLDKNNIPDEYLCEVCNPRPIDRKRARMMQSR